MSDRDSISVSDLLWVQCTSMDLFAVSDSDSDVSFAKSEMGVAPKFSVSD